MTTIYPTILTINGGSSSIKFSLYQLQEPLLQLFYGEIDRIAGETPVLRYTNPFNQEINSFPIKAGNHEEAAIALADWIEQQEGFDSIKGIGHRIVHGMQHTKPAVISPELLNELKKISVYDPEHLPEEINLIELFKKRYPSIPQLACFDTSFHASMPTVAKLLSIPRRYYEQGIRRYGFHGLSYAYLMDELERIAGKETAQGKIILAHLGSGASLAAIRKGKSIDTSMGFTPAAGLPMSTRTGDLDPGVALFLMKSEKLTAEAFNQLINHESGLLGISATSADVRDLMKVQQTDHRAAEALELFCYQTKKWVGAFAATLGGLETIVFSGGIGEHAPEIRSRICQGLGFLGIELDEIKNSHNEPIISTATGNVTVRVIHTNEELMIARLLSDLLNDSSKKLRV